MRLDIDISKCASEFRYLPKEIHLEVIYRILPILTQLLKGTYRMKNLIEANRNSEAHCRKHEIKFMIHAVESPD